MVVYLSCDLKGFTSTYIVFDVQSIWVTNQTDNSFAKLRASDGTQIFGWHFSFAYFNAKIMRCPLLLMGKSASILFWVSRAFRQSAFSFGVSSHSCRETFPEKLQKLFLGAKPPLFPRVDLFYQAFKPALVRFGRWSKSYNESASHHLHRVRLR
jgi:hypothetical protein